MGVVSSPAVAGQKAKKGASGAREAKSGPAGGNKASCPKGFAQFEFRAAINGGTVVTEGAVGGIGMSSKPGQLPILVLAECESKTAESDGQCITQTRLLDPSTSLGEGDVTVRGASQRSDLAMGLWKVVRFDESRMIVECGIWNPSKKDPHETGCLDRYMHVDRKTGELFFRASADESAPVTYWIASDDSKYAGTTARCIPRNFEIKPTVQIENAKIIVRGSLSSRFRGVVLDPVPVIVDMICDTDDGGSLPVHCATQRFVLGPAEYGDMELTGKGGRVGMRRIQSAWWDVFKIDESLLIAKCGDRSTFVRGLIAAACPDVYMHVNRKTGDVTFHESPDQ